MEGCWQAVLQLRQRVKRADHRNAPAVGEQQSQPARQPVVAVDDVVARAGERPKPLDTAGEIGQIIEHVVLVDVAVRTSVDVHHPRAGLVLHHVRHIHRLPTGEDVDDNPTRRECTSQLANVHIHPARFPAAQWRQWAGMRAQDGNSQRHATRR